MLLFIIIILVVLLIVLYCNKQHEGYDPNPCYSKNAIMNSCMDSSVKLYQADNPYNYARPIEPDYNGIFSSWNCGCGCGTQGGCGQRGGRLGY